MNIARRKPLTARIGIFGVGLDTYWEQFPGLLDDLLAKKEILKRKLSAHSVELFDFGMVTTPNGPRRRCRRSRRPISICFSSIC